MGTYNYCNPSNLPSGITDFEGIFEFAENGVAHFFSDMLPYYLAGNKNERNQ